MKNSIKFLTVLLTVFGYSHVDAVAWASYVGTLKSSGNYWGMIAVNATEGTMYGTQFTKPLYLGGLDLRLSKPGACNAANLVCTPLFVPPRQSYSVKFLIPIPNQNDQNLNKVRVASFDPAGNLKAELFIIEYDYVLQVTWDQNYVPLDRQHPDATRALFIEKPWYRDNAKDRYDDMIATIDDAGHIKISGKDGIPVVTSIGVGAGKLFAGNPPDMK